MNVHKWNVQKEVWSEVKVCARCKSSFMELTNIGRWECAFHPGKTVRLAGQRSAYDEKGRLLVVNNQEWSCCKRHVNPYQDNGCVPCDHTFGKLRVDFSDTLDGVRVDWLDELQTKEEAIIPTGKEGIVMIRRGDITERTPK